MEKDRTEQKYCEGIAVIYCDDKDHPNMRSFMNSGCKCIDRNKTIALVHHGGRLEKFWEVLADGAQRASRDLRVQLDILATDV